ncbi:MAG TPA: nucleotide sugar dehydrogenase [Chitinophagaceae bacterium]|nr:nucleotide sugar dehydrogenase [Chitinophagaceae bacterium]
MYQQLINKEYKLAVIGLGYVGLPIALEFAKKIAVIGFDINSERIKLLRQGIDPSREINKEAFKNTDIVFTEDVNVLKEANFFVVAVPTPVDDHKVPDLTSLLTASETIGRVIKKGDYVVFESTTYPGCTEEDCLPVIEKVSGLKLGSDFKLGYSPERINPGDKVHTLGNTVKIVSGSDAEALSEIAKVYEIVIAAGVHKSPTIKVAEAAKIIENTQRDLNISLMNELSIIFDLVGINTSDVMDAAGTKWNFHKYTPGLVGGHCIGVDPYYLTYKAQQLGYNSRVIAAGRFVNDEMPAHVAKKVIQHIIRKERVVSSAKVLVLGATFKENVSDIRNSKVAELVRELKSYSLSVDFYDPHAVAGEVKHEYGLDMATDVGKGYDAVILAVGHDVFKNNFTEDYYLSITNPGALLADLKGIYRNKILKLDYWSL